jgi:hypothetical protein
VRSATSASDTMAKNAAMSSRGMSGLIAEIAGLAGRRARAALTVAARLPLWPWKSCVSKGAVGDSDRSAQRVDVSRRKQPSGLFHPYTVTISTRADPLLLLHPVRTGDG